MGKGSEASRGQNLEAKLSWPGPSFPVASEGASIGASVSASHLLVAPSCGGYQQPDPARAPAAPSSRAMPVLLMGLSAWKEKFGSKTDVWTNKKMNHPQTGSPCDMQPRTGTPPSSAASSHPR